MKTLYETLLEALNKANEDFFIAEGKRILRANDACSKISGYGPAELLALSSPYELVVPEDRGLVFGGWPQDAQRMVKSHETAIIHKSRRRVDVEVAVKPLRGDGVRSVIILHDPGRGKTRRAPNPKCAAGFLRHRRAGGARQR